MRIPASGIPEAVAPAVRRLKETRQTGKNGETVIRREIHLWDKDAALGLLAKYHGLLVQKIEVSKTCDFKDDEMLNRMSKSSTPRR